MMSEGPVVLLTVGLGMIPNAIKGSVCIPGMSSGASLFMEQERSPKALSLFKNLGERGNP